MKISYESVLKLHNILMRFDPKMNYAIFKFKFRLSKFSTYQMNEVGRSMF